MRKRILLIVAPLCVVALAAGVAFAAPNDTESSNDARLDNPHAERPVAASPDQTSLELSVTMDQVVAFVQDVERQEIGSFLDGVAAEQAAEAEAAARAQAEAEAEAQAAAQARLQATRPVQSSTAGGNGFLACVKQRESGGNYTIHNYQGSGASGAYQIMPGTWNSIAASTGRNDLVGIDPASASPADQDAMAAALYAQQGAAPWGGGC
ncbi:MAG TPA: transglycosylase family protein [Acidimicrobiia bacterium]|nr:transglycosylase family protein [Acidimicrobiia bacterium]